MCNPIADFVARQMEGGNMARQAVGEWQVYDASGQRKYLNEGEVMRFLRAADQLAEPRRLLCYLLAYTGCRISEALALTHQQIDPLEGVVLATLKRRRMLYRRVPLPPFLLQQLRALSVGDGSRLWHFHRATAWRFIAQAMAQAGITGPMATIRGLRHAFGVRCATRAVPPSLIQRWMGHASLRMTMVYIDAIGNEERAFARRVWWTAGPREPACMITASPTIAPAAGGERKHVRQMRRDIDALRHENDRYRKAIHGFLANVPASGVTATVPAGLC
jgi:integrase/recombinase XerD